MRFLSATGNSVTCFPEFQGHLTNTFVKLVDNDRACLSVCLFIAKMVWYNHLHGDLQERKRSSVRSRLEKLGNLSH